MQKNINNTYFLIPARKGSKGLPFKNRKLLRKTLDIIPPLYYKNVYVSTDDEVIIDECKNYGVNLIKRPDEISTDESSVKDVMLHFLNVTKLINVDVILLYLTYPERTWVDVIKVYEAFKMSKGLSMICADEVNEHPYLCLYDKGNMEGELVIPHNLYRRQDYPKCFKHSLFVGCYNSNEIQHINGLLINEKTLYFKLDNKKIDVDTYEDLKKIENEN